MTQKKVFLIQTATSNNTLGLITLPHPKYSITCQFFIDSRSQQLYQIQSSSHPKECNSWFISHEQIVTDGSLYCATPFDVTFLMLPLLEKAQFLNRKSSDESDEDKNTATGIFCDRDQMIAYGFKDDQELIQLLTPVITRSKSIELLCDEKVVGSGDDEKVFRISEERVLKWLKRKVDRIVPALMNNPLFMEELNHSSSALSSKVFRRSLKRNSVTNKESVVDPEQLKQKATIQAMKILSDNVSVSWMEKLASQLGLTEELFPTSTKTMSSPSSSNFAKSSSTSSSSSSENTKKRKINDKSDQKSNKKQKQTVARSVSNLKKVDTSKMKSISSFFSPVKKND